jgi:hypothetical protein
MDRRILCATNRIDGTCLLSFDPMTGLLAKGGLAMKAIVLGPSVGVVFLIAHISAATAQDCRGCARNSPSVDTCIQCVKKNEGSKYTPAQMREWCGKNQPACYQGKGKSKKLS